VPIRKEITMTVKEKIIQVVEKLPADVTIEEAMERLLFLAKIERGLKQADEGTTVSHMEVKERMSKWLK
jgi:predicted transcriptional regulator